ncbi:hypothetical protein C7999DRAFT_35514 [Corynascus novoguineensis]|uniref:Uncharacterized protein n=1 Tax=Corynascus novoguineensis TaxID=1126955 RepID=A0AAN7HBX0_9PEZI|nr:hypothetical protein C7999DRAFT_35514 [Corynascus novoguineensis]
MYAPNSLAANQRRRRFPDRELLERVRIYEGLRHQNAIRFEPWVASAPATAEQASPSEDGKNPGAGGSPVLSTGTSPSSSLSPCHFTSGFSSGS